jgi:hypothetical protein
MKKIIRLTESDLEKIIKKILIEQSIAIDNTYNKTKNYQQQLYPNKNTKLSCVSNEMKFFVNYVLNNTESLSKQLNLDVKNLLYFTKLSLGVMSRETKQGAATEFRDKIGEFARSTFGFGFGDQSLGHAQFTADTWKKYGLDKRIGPYNDSFTSKKQGLGALFMLNDNYKKILSLGLQTGPSVNPILTKYGVISKIDGTGNNALDLAIISHNFNPTLTMTKYCKTSHPLYMASCNEPTKKIKYDPNSNLLKKVTDPNLKKNPGTVTVYTTQVVPNYFPNLAGPSHTAIGYLEEVVKKANTYNCF